MYQHRLHHIVPIPPLRKKYNFEAMHIGDHFFVLNGNIKSMQTIIFKASKRYGAKFTARAWTTADDKTHNTHFGTGVMVWRVE